MVLEIPYFHVGFRIRDLFFLSVTVTYCFGRLIASLFTMSILDTFSRSMKEYDRGCIPIPRYRLMDPPTNQLTLSEMNDNNKEDAK